MPDNLEQRAQQLAAFIERNRHQPLCWEPAILAALREAVNTERAACAAIAARSAQFPDVPGTAASIRWQIEARGENRDE